MKLPHYVLISVVAAAAIFCAPPASSAGLVAENMDWTISIISTGEVIGSGTGLFQGCAPDCEQPNPWAMLSSTGTIYGVAVSGPSTVNVNGITPDNNVFLPYLFQYPSPPYLVAPGSQVGPNGVEWADAAGNVFLIALDPNNMYDDLYILVGDPTLSVITDVSMSVTATPLPAALPLSPPALAV
jgi:hypothetical protein